MKLIATITTIVDVDVLANKDYFDTPEKLENLAKFWLAEDIRSATENGFLDEIIKVEVVE